jgi:WD40 repeat protein
MLFFKHLARLDAGRIILRLGWALLLVAGAAAQEKPILRLDTGGHMAVVTMMVPSPDGHQLYTASEDKTVRVWDIETGECLRVLRGWISSGHEGKIYALDINPAGEILAVGGMISGFDYPNTSIRLLNPKTGEVVRVLREHRNVVYNVKFSPDGRLLASSSGDRTARIWPVDDLTTATLRERFVLEGHEGDIYGLAWSPDGKILATAGNDKRLILWDAQTGRQLRSAESDSAIGRCVFSPDGRSIVTGEDSGAVKLWDAANLGTPRVLRKVEGGDLTDIAFSPDGSVLACAGSHIERFEDSWRRPVFLLNPVTGEQTGAFYMHNNTIQGIAFDPHGRWIATAGGNDNEIWVWNPASTQPIRRLQGQGRAAYACAFGLREASIFFGNINEHKNLQAENSITGGYSLSRMGPLKWSEIEGGNFKSAYREANGKTIETEGLLYQPDISIGGNKIDWPYEGDTITCHTFTPDGKYAIVGSEFAITLFDVESGRRLGFFSGHEGGVWGLSVSPDGRLLLSASKDQSLKLWRVDTRELVATFFFAADGEWVVWTRSGYYAASAQGDKYVGWHLNGETDEAAEFFHAEQFRPVFNRPDVVKSAIFLGSEEEGLKRANQLLERVKEEAHPDQIQLIRPPRISFTNPEDGSFTREEAVRLEYAVESVREVKVVRVTVNGRMLDRTRDRGLSILGRDRGAIEVPLDPGLNRITVFAMHDLAMARREVRVRRIGKDEAPPGAMRPGRLLILSIGVDEYPNLEKNAQLVFTQNDAREIAGAFESLRGRLFADVELRLLAGKDGALPDGDAVREALKLFAKSEIQDTCVLFIAGHAITSRDGTYYFVPRDAKRLPNGALNSETLVHWNAIRQALDVPGSKIMLVDTCHAAAASGSSQTEINNDELFKILQDDSTVILTASRSTEKAAENPRWGHGAFTKSLLEGARDKKADANQDGLVSISEIDQFVSQAVPKMTNNAQTPITFAPKGGEALVIYK